MQIPISRLSRSSFPPRPQRPQPEPPQTRSVQPPMIYVYEKQAWEYKIVARSATLELVSEQELNALGEDGWELAGVATRADTVQFYFKRMRK